MLYLIIQVIQYPTFINLIFVVVVEISVIYTLFTMVVSTFTHDYKSPIAPSRMFKALITDSSNLLPKLLPQFIKDINLIQGNGEAGSIEQVNFADG